MRCAHCEAEFTPKNVRGRFCSDKCLAAAWQAHREHALPRIEQNLADTLTQVQAIRQRRARPGLMAAEGRGGHG